MNKMLHQKVYGLPAGLLIYEVDGPEKKCGEDTYVTGIIGVSSFRAQKSAQRAEKLWILVHFQHFF